MKNNEEIIFLEKNIQENKPLAEKWQDGKHKRTRPKKKRGYRKEESNDSPEISDKRMPFNIQRLPSGRWPSKTS